MKNVSYVDFLDILESKDLDNLAEEVKIFKSEVGRIEINVNYVYKGSESYWLCKIEPSRKIKNRTMYIHLVPSKSEFLDFDYIVNYMN